tara:strand:- start:13 stop:213 length:201 start_codon:yes stop_codon:yes gene_type:complete
MADVKTITQELSESSLGVSSAFESITGGESIVDIGDQKEMYNIITKLVEKIDELVTEINTIKSSLE